MELMHYSDGAERRWEDSRPFHREFKVVETDRPPTTIEEFEKLLKQKIGQTAKSSSNEVHILAILEISFLTEKACLCVLGLIDYLSFLFSCGKPP